MNKKECLESLQEIKNIKYFNPRTAVYEFKDLYLEYKITF